MLTVPGRVNLIGEHIDYHNLDVLPMAIPRSIRIDYRPHATRALLAVSTHADSKINISFDAPLVPGPPGHWENYAKAAIKAVQTRWNLSRGIEAEVTSDLPAAAGLSSSSALLTAFTLALLRANDISAGFQDLMDILPDGEHFVGTRGGGMDHAAVLASRAGSALLVGFAPLSTVPVPIPKGWEWLVAHCLVTAEKSSAVREEYNSRRTAATAGLNQLGFQTFTAAIASEPIDALCARASRTLQGERLLCFLHVVTEAARVHDAVSALRSQDITAMGRLLDCSHASMRDQLRISCPEMDALVVSAREAGAVGARLTGAGFGGCAVILCREGERSRLRSRLIQGHYANMGAFDQARHLIDAEPSAGALFN